MARLVQPELQQRLGATIIIENRPGASGSVGTAVAAKSPPDGNTWLIVFDNHAANPFVLSTCLTTPRRISSPSCSSVPRHMYFRRIRRNLWDARRRHCGGKGEAGHGDLRLGGQRQHRTSGDGAVVKAGRGAARSRTLSRRRSRHERCDRRSRRPPRWQHRALHSPDSGRRHQGGGADGKDPLGNAGHGTDRHRKRFPGIEAYAWWGVFAPAGTPKSTVNRFADELAACLREPRVARQLTETQQISLALTGAEELRKFLGEQMRMWGAVVREHNIKAD